jgi:hypothetical protein
MRSTDLEAHTKRDEMTVICSEVARWRCEVEVEYSVIDLSSNDVGRANPEESAGSASRQHEEGTTSGSRGSNAAYKTPKHEYSIHAECHF